eukprot:CAMPEP_0194504264 /NCGR_PEP_ID=MMETSP0253-20130528/28848_1 /TAXON_ID=2966 /ORGANISM="Noctiluca scintillans" /LENGTH=72 /DNA_ID=CAMNT_0039346637 /DNA_START=49 /DNA_END=267 /DNA_ORIENTATION=+
MLSYAPQGPMQYLRVHRCCRHFSKGVAATLNKTNSEARSTGERSLGEPFFQRRRFGHEPPAPDVMDGDASVC